jgi:drug/metabolite transporter (DMT)-like permease
MTMHLYTGWVGALLASLALPFVWTALDLDTVGRPVPDGPDGHGGPLCLLILAYQRAPAATLTPYLYAQIGFAMLGGWLVFAHVPRPLVAGWASRWWPRAVRRAPG